jgi:hypothetical protein
MKTKLLTVYSMLLPAFSCFSQEKESLIRNWIIPAREIETDNKLIDLTNYYTAALDDDWLVSAGANLKRLPKGVQKFGNVNFDIRGIIQLGGLNLYKLSDYSPEEQKNKYPEKVTGIIINQKAVKVNFLHASSWGEEKNKEIGRYIINYEDGTSLVILLKYLDSLRDWWFIPGDEMPGNATIAWKGLNDLTEKKGFQIFLYNYIWENPFANKTIKSIDYVSTMTGASPFLVAITLEN